MRKPHKSTVISVIVVFVLIAVMLLLNRASIGRAMKDMWSEAGNGMNRTVTVYDVEGDVTRTYEGKFDIDYDGKRVKFDDEEGHRHIIIPGMGMVIIDEN